MISTFRVISDMKIYFLLIDLQSDLHIYWFHYLFNSSTEDDRIRAERLGDETFQYAQAFETVSEFYSGAPILILQSVRSLNCTYAIKHDTGAELPKLEYYLPWLVDLCFFLSNICSLCCKLIKMNALKHILLYYTRFGTGGNDFKYVLSLLVCCVIYTFFMSMVTAWVKFKIIPICDK